MSFEVKLTNVLDRIIILTPEDCEDQNFDPLKIGKVVLAKMKQGASSCNPAKRLYFSQFVAKMEQEKKP